MNPTFLRRPDPPRSHPRPDEPITQRELIELWSRVGIIQRARRDTRISRSDLYGLLAMVAALAWCFGFYMGHP